MMSEEEKRELDKIHDECIRQIEEDPRIIFEDIYSPREVSRIIDRQDRYEVLKRQSWRCNFCNETLKFNKNSNWDGKVAHIDHIHPFSHRETYTNGKNNINELSNLQALCPKCNLSKGKKNIN